MKVAFRYVIVSKVDFVASGEHMRYQDSQQHNSLLLEKILSVVNAILLIVFAVCFNYLVIDFLF